MRESLLKLMNLPSVFEDVVKSDGAYIAMAWGDIGYNHFLGSPSEPHPGPGREHMLMTWHNLGEDEQKAVVALARAKGIDLAREFGVPVMEVGGV